MDTDTIDQEYNQLQTEFQDVANTVQSERASMQFKANVPHPEGDGLIFYPKIDFRNAEALVDHALAHAPQQA